MILEYTDIYIKYCIATYYIIMYYLIERNNSSEVIRDLPNKIPTYLLLSINNNPRAFEWVCVSLRSAGSQYLQLLFTWTSLEFKKEQILFINYGKPKKYFPIHWLGKWLYLSSIKWQTKPYQFKSLDKNKREFPWQF